MHRENRTRVFSEVAVPVFDLWSGNLEQHMPAPELIAEEELLKILDAGSEMAASELRRREMARTEHILEGRARWVFTASRENLGKSFWVCSKQPQEKTNLNDHGERIWSATLDRHDAVWRATRQLEHQDAGGVIYAERYGWEGGIEVIDVRPNSCAALERTGEHDWSYAGTGDDVCRSCGLVV